METIVVYYEDNKNYGLESQIKDAVISHQGLIKSEFAFENQVHQSLFTFKNSGNLKNFQSDLKRISGVFNIKVYIGGYFS